MMKRRNAYRGKKVFFADLHNHCNISYAHGSLGEALNNGRQRLDVCSVTGHAHWPDMPSRDGKIDHIIDFHEEGFRKLSEGWREDLELMRGVNREGRFLVFPGFEIHSMEAGDYTILSKDFDADLMYPGSMETFRKDLKEHPELRERLIAFPHHIGYKNGRRGINWDQFDDGLFPLVEIYSMHGCAESEETDLPFLHTMGPCSGYGTMRYGLGPAGKKFGVLANTDHHSAHPGSYGHGLTGIWADELSRESIWEALHSRRSYAMSADKMELEFSVDSYPMGSIVTGGHLAEGGLKGKGFDEGDLSGGGQKRGRRIDFRLRAGGPLDYVDIIKNGELFSRFSGNRLNEDSLEEPQSKGEGEELFRTIIYLETGWGERHKAFDWEVRFGIDRGRILDADARFRGDEVVSPLDASGEETVFFRSSWDQVDEKTVSFTTRSSGNPTNSTPATQGLAVEVEAPWAAELWCRVNGEEYRLPLARLREESFIDYSGGFDSPAFKIHRAPSEYEYTWGGSLLDSAEDSAFYYLRARQKSGAWAWSSPVWFEA